jgi:sterol 3beta-glucosyltransferase
MPPMKITIITTGSRGDTQPYIALGMELKRSGHSVKLAAFQNYESFVTAYGLDFFPIQGDVSRVAASLNGNDAMETDNPLKVMLSFNKLKSYVFELQKDFFEACRDSDLILYHPGTAIGYFAARHFKIPSMLASPFPMSPTREYPALIFYNGPRLGREYNGLTHRLFGQIMWQASASPLKEFWKKELGELPPGFSNPFARQGAKDLPVIISCSKFVFPVPKDWSKNIHMAGYWFLDESDWHAPSDLLDFLQQGTPPVYVGFGSIGNPELAAQTSMLVMEALERAGQRGVLATGWGGMSTVADVPNTIFMLESAPHSWLFPRMAAVVHHGGAGTTAEGLRAGKPSILIPHGNDQFAWGRRVHELGVGPKPIPRKKLTAENLAEAIQQALSEEIRDAAGNLGTHIRSEQGVWVASQIITDCAR